MNSTTCKEQPCSFLYEASACGSIPIIRNLEEYYDNDLLTSLEGICNGTTNYILTKTSEEHISYADALKGAEQSGFAESDPTLDVKGFDAKFKLTILLTHTFGIFVKHDRIFNFGIQNLSAEDSTFAKEKGFRIKLIAHTLSSNGKLLAYVMPKFIHKGDMFYDVRNEFNAVQLEASFSDKQFFYGKGAGSHPTASAVLSDLAALIYDYHYDKKYNQRLENNPASNGSSFTNDYLLNVYLRYSDDKLLKDLQFTEIDQQFMSHNYKYVIGKVSVAKLLEHKINDRDDVFVVRY